MTSSTTEEGLRWQRIQSIFEEALTQDGAAREAFLAEACGTDAPLKAEVEELLSADTQAGDFLEQAVAGGSALLGAKQDPLAGRRILGKYEVLERIGEGGFGAVYKGLDTILQRNVAIKVCTSRRGLLRERFLREAEIAAGLQHPNVTTLHDLGFDGETPFLVQEFLKGEDLEAKIERRDDLSLDERVGLLLQIARGLEYAHQQGVLHRDVKPANIRVLPNGQAKIMDFGIARLLGQDSGLTQEGEALGTVGYLAPEQLRGERLDERADLFAYGVLAYELLTYQKPFLGDSFSQVSYQVLYEEPKPLSAHVSNCPRQLDQIIARCLIKDREHRYSRLSEVIRDLEDLDFEPPDSASFNPRTPTAPAASPAGRRRAVLLASGVVVAAALIAWLGSKASPGRTREVAELPHEASLGILPPPSAPTAPRPSLEEEPKEESAEVARPALGTADDGKLRQPASAGRAPSKELPRGSSAADSRSSGASIGEPTAPAGTLDASSPDGALREDAQLPTSAEGSLSGASLEAGPLPSATAARPAADHGEGAEPPAGRAPLAAGALSVEVPGLRNLASAESGQSPDLPAVKSEAELFTAGEGVVPPQLIDRPAPIYPERARRRKREGRVVVAVLVDSTGKVEHALVKSGEGRGLGFEESALAAARQAVFRPAIRGGKKGKMWTELSFDFLLE